MIHHISHKSWKLSDYNPIIRYALPFLAAHDPVETRTGMTRNNSRVWKRRPLFPGQMDMMHHAFIVGLEVGRR